MPPVTMSDVAFAGTITSAPASLVIVTDVGVPAGSQSRLRVTGRAPPV